MIITLYYDEQLTFLTIVIQITEPHCTFVIITNFFTYTCISKKNRKKKMSEKDVVLKIDPN